MLDSTRYKNSDALFVQCFSVDRKVPVPELRGKKITPFPKTVKCTTSTLPTAVAGKGSLPFLGKNHSTSHRTQFLWAVCSQSPASGSLFLVKGRGEWIDSPGLGLHVLRSTLCSTRKALEICRIAAWCDRRKSQKLKNGVIFKVCKTSNSDRHPKSPENRLRMLLYKAATQIHKSQKCAWKT